MANTRKKINVLSFDFDGCVCHEKVIYSRSPQRMIEANQSLLKTIRKRWLEEQYDEAIFMVGSNRQDKVTDDVNGSKGAYGYPVKGSCVTALHELHAECDMQIRQDDAAVKMNLRIDGYLLADNFGGHMPGQTFEAIRVKDETFNHSRYVFDISKVTLLYAQMHKIAAENPDAEIVFDFFDDKYDPANPGKQNDILAGLRLFFSLNEDLIPKNMRLRLNHYNGGEVNTIADIQGSSRIDENYEARVWDMLYAAEIISQESHANRRPPDFNKEYDVRKELLKNNRLEKFKQIRDEDFRRLDELNKSIAPQGWHMGYGCASIALFSLFGEGAGVPGMMNPPALPRLSRQNQNK